MTRIAWVTFATAIGAGAVDWIAVAHANPRLRWVSKPTTILLLVGAALALHPASNEQRDIFVAALLVSLAGDIALLKDDHWFRAGLAAFLVGHLTYSAGFLVGGLDRGRLAYAAVGVALVSLGLGGRIIRSILGSDRRSMALPVAGYLLAISAMVALAVAGGKPAAIAGAVLFYASDGMIAWNRFVRSLPWSPLPVIITYHLAQAGLVLSLAS
jgi:alkenylglycerophosphocholine hydrolase